MCMYMCGHVDILTHRIHVHVRACHVYVLRLSSCWSRAILVQYTQGHRKMIHMLVCSVSAYMYMRDSMWCM